MGVAVGIVVCVAVTKGLEVERLDAKPLERKRTVLALRLAVLINTRSQLRE